MRRIVMLLWLFAAICTTTGVIYGDVDAFNDVIEHFQEEDAETCRKLTSSSLEKVVNRLFPDLENAKDEASSCITTKNIRTLVNPASVDLLTREEFSKASVVLLYLLSDRKKSCTMLTSNIDYYLNWLKDTNNGHLNETVTALLQQFADKQPEGTAEDKHAKYKCFNVEHLEEKTSLSGGDPSRQSKAAAALIISYLATGYVILDDCPEMPSRDSFVEAIFDHLGVPEGKSMSVEKFEELLTDLKIMPSSEGDTDDNHDDHDDHDDHRNKRAALSRHKRETAENGHDEHDEHDEGLMHTCLGESILDVFHVEEDEGLTSSQFSHLCPALIQQQLEKSCSHADHAETKTPTNAQKYGYGTLAVVLISLVSLIGVLVVPCGASERYRGILAFFVALAVGSLISDATLHLIPLAMGIHMHDHDSDGPIVVEQFVYRGLVIIAAMYFFLLMEAVIVLSNKKDNKVSEIDLSNIENVEKQKPEMDAHIKVLGVPTVGWMILLSDAIHNFADGLVIGAAFNASLASGLSTSIAVFCHELPHEIGDFAVMVNAGMSRLKAAGLNLLSALTAVVGFYVGIVLSSNDEVRAWIFTATAGMFIYVSLANMVPELMSMLRGERRIQRFVLQNLGFLLGVTLLTLIAVFESKIKV